jgi:shikimate kinase
MANIIIIGMRGVGKTTIGRLLSERLQKKWIDIDEEIVRREGKTIPEMVELHGWDFFRQKEHEEVMRLVEQENLVISTGGGVLMYFNNSELLKASGKLVLLTAESSTLAQRLRESHQRPSLSGKDPLQEIDEIWEQRRDLYLKCADMVVDTEHWDDQRIVDEILTKLL